MTVIVDPARTFLKQLSDAATEAGHIWPGYAACEGALESAWGKSELFLQDNNIFGMKQHSHPTYGTVNLPTKEYINKKWVVVEAAFVKYDNIMESFKDRMVTVIRLAPFYLHYKCALAASNGEDFITYISTTWSTDPLRAKKVLDIYHRYFRDLAVGL